MMTSLACTASYLTPIDPARSFENQPHAFKKTMLDQRHAPVTGFATGMLAGTEGYADNHDGEVTQGKRPNLLEFWR
jgi:hypothetical protein